jgi:hypothetical protein
MGTRSITRIQKDGETLVAVYRQFDGYISGQGRDLANILKDRKIVNGIQFGTQSQVFNGVGCLAANIICEMKREDNGDAGGVYIHPVDADDEEYVYNVNVKTKEGDWSYAYEDYPTVTVIRWGEEVFNGTSLEFQEFVQKDEDDA